MAIRTVPYDSAEFLDTPEAQAAYLAEALEEDDPAAFTHALGVVARAQGMAQITQETGLGRESLYKALREGGNPEFATIMRVLKALRLKLTTRPA